MTTLPARYRIDDAVDERRLARREGAGEVLRIGHMMAGAVERFDEFVTARSS
jgi:hypothetical protein